MNIILKIFTIIKFTISIIFALLSIFNFFNLFEIKYIFNYLFFDNNYYLIFIIMIFETIIMFILNFLKLGLSGTNPQYRVDTLHNLKTQGGILSLMIIGNIFYFLNLKEKYSIWMLIIAFILEFIIPICLVFIESKIMLIENILDFFENIIYNKKKKKEKKLKEEEEKRILIEKEKLEEEVRIKTEKINNCLNNLNQFLIDELEKDVFYLLKESIKESDFNKIEDNIGLLEAIVDDENILNIMNDLKTCINN